MAKIDFASVLVANDSVGLRDGSLADFSAANFSDFEDRFSFGADPFADLSVRYPSGSDPINPNDPSFFSFDSADHDALFPNGPLQAEVAVANPLSLQSPDALTSSQIAPTAAVAEPLGATMATNASSPFDIISATQSDLLRGESHAADTITGGGELIGTSGDDTFVVTGSTTGINGEGGNDVAVFEDVSNSEFNWYTITPSSDGGFNVKDVHATGQSVDVIDVQTLQFNDGSYNVATGVFTASSGSGTSGPSHQITAPSVPHATSANDIVGLLLQNNTSSTEAKGTVTFGEIFAKGAVMPGTQLEADIDGQEVAVQMDVKSTNADGSIRQAILTLESPQIAAGASASVMLMKGPGAASAPAITAQDILNDGYNLKVNVALHNANGTTTDVTVDAAQVLKSAISDGKVETWLSGAQTGEYDVTQKIAPNLSVTFDIKKNADGTTNTDVTFSHDTAYTTHVSTLDYDVSISQNNQTVFSQNNIQQYAFSTWDTEINSSGAIAPHVVYDMQYLIDTGAIPSYDLTGGVASSSIDAESQKLSDGDIGPMGTGTITTYMPETGGRPDIGAEPTWVVDYLVSQDQTAEQSMFANANEAGSVPWHLIGSDGQPVSVYDDPELWVDPRGEGSEYGDDALPVPFSDTAGSWTLDTAHQPDLSYVPYLLSGSQNDLNNLKEQAAYLIASYNPAYRGATGDLIPDGYQVRAKAWDLRDIGNVAYALPDSDPMKAYFTKVIDDNLQHIINTYVDGSVGAAEGALAGWIGGTYGSTPGVMAPWQQDYFAITMNELGEQGFTQAYTILKWEDNFLSGRFLNGANGFNPNEGLAYNLQIGSSSTGADYTTWQQVYEASFGTTEPTTIQGDATSSGGYGAVARAGLASDISGTESTNAIEAYAWLVSQTPDITTAFASDPTWDIVPRLADGLYLTNDKVQIAASTSDVILRAGSDDSMLLGGSGKDTLIGGGGIDILLAGSGDSTLQGRSGNDYLFAGNGADLLIGGGGSDYLQAGSGTDTFAYRSAWESTGAGYDTISGFNFATDKISVPGKIGLIDAAVNHGHLSTSTFDANLSTALGAADLGPHDAVLFTASSGTLAGETFLVIDVNGVAGYQAGSDLVIHLEYFTGNMTTANFS